MKKNTSALLFKGKMSIQTRVFVSFACLVIGMIVVFLIFFSTYATNNIIERANENMSNTAALLKSRLDDIVQNMNRVSLGLSFSQEIRGLLLEGQDMPLTERLSSEAAAKQAITTAYSLSNPIVLQVNVIRANGQFLGAGNAPYLTQIPEETFWATPWIQNTLDKEGLAYLTYPRVDEWSKSGKLVFSVTRMVVGSFNYVREDYSNIAVTEVQQDYASIEAAVRSVSGNTSIDTYTMIFDGSGALVYPYGNKDGYREIWALVESEPVNGIIETVIDGIPVMLYSLPCDFSDWTIVYAVNRQDFLSEVKGYQSVILITGIFMFAIALLLAYLLSQRLTLPIRQMANDAHMLNLNTSIENLDLGESSNLREVDELQNAYRTMLERLQNSLAETITIRSLEMQSRMMALQTQMNPHFLYNSISTIHIMAGQEGNARIVEFCEDLSSLLRYALREYSEIVQIRDETEFSRTYLNIMSKRYLDDLEYEINMPESLDDISVPKLIVQPLIENCFKYGMGNAPPLKISVTGSVRNGMWQISVADNGFGFSDEIKNELLGNLSKNPYIEEIAQRIVFSHIGLSNIFGRLNLLYGEKTVFEISSNDWGGATVTIGGPIEK